MKRPDPSTLALELCRESMARDLTSSEVKLASWLIAAEDKLGMFALEFSLREIKEGCERGAIKLPGWGAHYRTLNAAIDGLKDHGLLAVHDGTKKRFGHMSKVFVLLG